MKIAISAESTIDITEEIKKANDIKIVPFQIFLGDENKLDGEITSKEIIEFVNKNKTLPKTGAVNSIQFEEHFKNIKKEYDAIIHFSLSSELSSAYNNAKSVADTMENVYVIDTRSLSTGIALLALYAVELKKQGLEAKDIYEKCLKRVPFVQTSFELMRLDYLYKGGRCSSLAYFGANLLKIRPQIIVKNGKMVSGKKYRGNFEHVVNKYCEDVLSEFNTPDLSTVFITYTTASDEVVDSVKKLLQNRGFKNIYVTTAGGTITSHCGENCLGILYINDGNMI